MEQLSPKLVNEISTRTKIDVADNNSVGVLGTYDDNNFLKFLDFAGFTPCKSEFDWDSNISDIDVSEGWCSHRTTGKKHRRGGKSKSRDIKVSKEEKKSSNSRSKQFKDVLAKCIKFDKFKFRWISISLEDKTKLFIPLQLLEVLNNANLRNLEHFFRKVCLDTVTHRSIQSGTFLTGIYDLTLYWAILFEVYPDAIFTPYFMERYETNSVRMKVHFRGTRIFNETTGKILKSVRSAVHQGRHSNRFEDIANTVCAVLTESHFHSMEEGDNEVRAILIIVLIYNTEGKVVNISLDMESSVISRYARVLLEMVHKDRSDSNNSDSPILCSETITSSFSSSFSSTSSTSPSSMCSASLQKC